MRQSNAHTTDTLIDTLAYRFVMTSLVGFGGLAILAGLYLTKSAMGIDLLDGPSPLHGVFF